MGEAGEADRRIGRKGERRRTQELPPILRHGFRPFFLLGPVFAAFAVLCWLALLADLAVLPGAADPLAWHQHEMLFGFASAVVAGFILTAIPNWTGRLPVNGLPLAALAGLWIAGRIAMFAGTLLGSATTALIEGTFLIVLAALVGREIVSGGNWRNLVPATLIAWLAIGNAAFHLEHGYGLALDGIGTRLAIAALAMLIGMIGGRIVPSFTRNWLVKRQAAALPSPFGIVDKLALITLAIALLGWVFLPESRSVGFFLAVAGVAQMIRLARWQGWRCVAEPLVLILHVGYGWLGLGLLLLGLANLASPFSDLAALHALTTGAFGTMMLAVMTRATLGHTGRALTADGWTLLIYAAVTLGALARTISPLIPDETWLEVAGLLWAGAFLLFALTYGPMLLRANPKRAGA
ncbi:MAG: NnrS family protein [Alphaproteobacteria bacterium]